MQKPKFQPVRAKAPVKNPAIDFHKKMIGAKQIDLFIRSPIPKLYRLRGA